LADEVAELKMLKPRIPAGLKTTMQKDSTRILSVVLVMLFSALSGAIAPLFWWIALPLFIATGIGGVLMSDQYARKNRVAGNLEGLVRHSQDIDELREEYSEVLRIDRETIQELKQRYQDLSMLCKGKDEKIEDLRNELILAKEENRKLKKDRP
jgi:cell shape-determining protein MreC